MTISLQQPFTIYRAPLAFMQWDDTHDNHALWSAMRSHDAHKCLHAINTMWAHAYLRDAGTLSVQLDDIYRTMTSSDEQHWTATSAYEPSAIAPELAMYAVEHGDLFTDTHGTPFLAWDHGFIVLTLRDGVFAML